MGSHAITQANLVYLPDGNAKRYAMGDTISGGDLLPGIELDEKAIFED